MKNKRNALEEQLYRQYTKAEADVNPAVWQQISDRLDRQNKRKFPYLWISLSAIAAIIFLCTFLLTRQQNNATEHPTIQPAEQKNSKQQSENASAMTPVAKSDRTIGKTQTSASILAVNTYNKNRFRSDAFIHNCITETIILPEINQSTSDAGQTSLKTQLHQPSVIGLSGETITTSDKPSSGNEAVINDKNIRQRQLLTFIPLEGARSSLDLKVEINENYSPVISHPRRLKTLALSEAGIGIPFRNIQHQPSESGLFNSRAENEHPILVQSYFAGMGLILDKSWTLTSGVEFQQLVEKFSYVKDDATHIIIKYDPSSHQPIDTVVTRGKLTEQALNRYSLVNIPVYVGYEKRYDRWLLGLEGGVGFNVSLDASGKILKNDQDVISLSDQTDIYNPSIGMSLRIGVKGLYALNRRTSVYIKSQFQHNTEPWTLGSHPNDIRYRFLSCNVGLWVMI